MNQLLYSKLGSIIKVESSLATSIGQIQLDRPVMLASGILGISLDVFNRLYRSGAGAVVTKSLSKEPWDGYPNPTIFSVKGDGWINAVGLSNPGAPNFAKMIEPNQIPSKGEPIFIDYYFWPDYWACFDFHTWTCFDFHTWTCFDFHT